MPPVADLLSNQGVKEGVGDEGCHGMVWSMGFDHLAIALVILACLIAASFLSGLVDGLRHAPQEKGLEQSNRALVKPRLREPKRLSGGGATAPHEL